MGQTVIAVLTGDVWLYLRIDKRKKQFTFKRQILNQNLFTNRTDNVNLMKEFVFVYNNNTIIIYNIVIGIQQKKT